MTDYEATQRALVTMWDWVGQLDPSFDGPIEAYFTDEEEAAAAARALRRR